MKKLLLVIISPTLMLSICVGGGITLEGAESRTDVDVVFDSEAGETPNTSVDAWGFFVVVGNVWGQTPAAE